MLKGWNTHEYTRWHWNTNHKANATYVDQKPDGETNRIFKIEFLLTGPRCPTCLPSWWCLRCYRLLLHNLTWNGRCVGPDAYATGKYATVQDVEVCFVLRFFTMSCQGMLCTAYHRTITSILPPCNIRVLEFGEYCGRCPWHFWSYEYTNVMRAGTVSVTSAITRVSLKRTGYNAIND
jgi:hypothetical protein